MENSWFVIVNPTSGNGTAKKNWNTIVYYLNYHNIEFEYCFSKYSKHEIELVLKAIASGYRKLISIGGDGTLHQIVNGVMAQKIISKSDIKIGVIPVGTGNDWVKTYSIPKKIKEAVSIIKKENVIQQDIGCIELLNADKKVYFNNIAGLGFDGFVVNNIAKYKKLRYLAYLIGTLSSFFNYKNIEVDIEFNSMKIRTKCLLTLFGICNFFGGGMKLTSNVNTTDGLFDISIVKDFTLLSILKNVLKFYNGKITDHKEVETYKTKTIYITPKTKDVLIQADGELIGTGGLKAFVLPKAINFVIP